jgi:hypothetical protein
LPLSFIYNVLEKEEMPMPIKSYPIIPAKTWWALRNRFKQRMSPKITTNYLQSLLGMSEKAAKSILPHLKNIQLIDADGSINERTSLWRDDQQYAAVCDLIKQEVYPKKLIRSIQGPVIDTKAAVEWFVTETGVSINTAKKMARFYQLLSIADCSADSHLMKTVHSENQQNGMAPVEDTPTGKKASTLSEQPDREIVTPVQFNIHIHIPPDASAAQIDQIFSSAAKHLKPDA